MISPRTVQRFPGWVMVAGGLAAALALVVAPEAASAAAARSWPPFVLVVGLLLVGLVAQRDGLFALAAQATDSVGGGPTVTR